MIRQWNKHNPAMGKLVTFLCSAVFAFFLGLPAAQAFHFPWDQGHDTTDWNDPPSPGPCTGSNCDPCNASSSPVYVPTGHFIWSETDINLKGIPNIQLSRTYNSHDPRDGLFGNGWIAGCETGLFLTQSVDEKQFILRWPNGKRFVYNKATDGSYIPPAGRFERIEVQGDHMELISLNGSKLVFNENGKISSRIDQNGNAINYSYDTNTDLLVSIIDEQNRGLNLTYNSGGRVVLVNDHNGRSWSYDYDVNGNLISSTDPLGGVQRYFYEPYKPSGEGHTYYHINKVTDPTGVVITEVTYSGEKVSSYTEGEDRFTYSYNTNTLSVTKTDSFGGTRTIKYNADQVITSISDPLGNIEQFEYDVNGRLSVYTDLLGNEWKTSYDNKGRLLKQTNPLNRTTSYEYNGDNQDPTKITTPTGRTLELSYDNQFNPTQIQDQEGIANKLSWDDRGNQTGDIDALGNIASSTYNETNQPTNMQDELGRAVNLQYDDRGNLVQVTNPGSEITKFKYDLLDRRVSIIDPEENKTTYSYDASGRLIELSDPAGEKWQFEYDTFGRLIKETTPDNDVTQYSYNTRNLVNRVLLPNGKQIINQFDAAKRLIKKTVGSVSSDYTYDKRGNIIAVVQNGIKYTLSYDKAGHLLSQEDDLGTSKVSYNYNQEGEITGYQTTNGISVSYERNSRGFISQVANNNKIFNYEYDSKGREIRKQLSNGLQIDQQFDATGRLTQINHDSLDQYTFKYDDSGRITEKTSSSFNWRYNYDSASRLVSAQNGTISHSYSYDELGNRLDFGGQYNAYNQLTEDNTFTYQYDLAGNLTRKEDKTSGEHWVYLWDDLNELEQVSHFPNLSTTTPDITASYVYDPYGRRIQKTVNGITTDFQWMGSLLISEIQDGQIVKRYGYRDDQFTPITVTNANGTYVVHKDHLGTPLFLTDDERNVVWKADYSPYGEANVSEDPDANGEFISFNLRLPGQYLDQETGLHYNNFRYYNPRIGRYISSDPIEYMKDTNAYVYAGSNPISRLDVLGLAWGNGRALRHFYFGGGASVSLQTTGHYGAVTIRIQPQRNQFKNIARKAAEMAAKALGCNQSSFIKGNDRVGANSGVFWIGGFTLFRKYECNLSKSCKNAMMCPPQKIKTFSFSCTLELWMRDRFEDPSDFDNSKGTPNENFWDDWEYGGTPFDVTGNWNDSVSGGGTI